MSASILPRTCGRRSLVRSTFAACCLLIVLASSAFGQPGKQNDPLSWDRSISRLVSTYCTRCHNHNQTRGDVNLARDENPRMILQHRQTWETALVMIEAEEMPPDGQRQPSKRDRELLIQFLTETLEAQDPNAARDPGKPTLRRLNRVEYDNAVADLTGLDLHLADGFPPDPSGYGFDNIGDALTLTPVQVEQYHEAAKTIVRALLDSKQVAPDAYDTVFFIRPDGEVEESAAARRIVQRFATRAFRRPVNEGFVDRLLEIYAQARSLGQPHDTAVGHMLTAVLISPRFLMRVEDDQPDETGPYAVDDFELATRLSFFLWSRPPDETLLELAAKEELGKIDVLERQARRMLADRRSKALVDNFFGQWLGLREMQTHQPDQAHFPEFDDSLREAMLDEVHAVLLEILQQNRSLTELIDCDFTYVNERLAAFYGLEEVTGSGMQRIPLPDRRRGGLLTSAAILMLQSDPTRTNIPRRGNYIAGRILGAPPPPPPPGVPPLDDATADGQVRTLRETFELHRNKSECASCHAKIDPIGFSLENYDAIGRWREEDAGLPIDASAELPDGRSFEGPVELKQVLLERKEQFLRTLARNMLIYALGRGLQSSDNLVIRDMLEATEADRDRCWAMVLTIIKSYPFRYRRNPEY